MDLCWYHRCWRNIWARRNWNVTSGGSCVQQRCFFSWISETNPNRPSTSFRMFFPYFLWFFRHLQVTKWRKIRRHVDFSFGKLAISTILPPDFFHQQWTLCCRQGLLEIASGFFPRIAFLTGEMFKPLKLQGVFGWENPTTKGYPPPWNSWMAGRSELQRFLLKWS